MQLKVNKGQLLVADPSMIGDYTFTKAVVLVVDHNKGGTVGFIVNKPLDYQLQTFVPEIQKKFPIYNGGPVEQDTLFYIHRKAEIIPNSIEIGNHLYWGGDFNAISTHINMGSLRAEDIKFFLGYSGWEAEQLHNELNLNSWLIFDQKKDEKMIQINDRNLWSSKIKTLGGDYIFWANSPSNPNLN